jgi:nucleotide-binding universal stress UspA family protein
MTFQRILIAVDNSPLAAHAANVGFDLARALHGEVALITVVDPLENAAPESGVPAVDLIAFAEKDGRRLLADVGARSAIQPPPLSFVPVGKPGVEILKTAGEWPADLIVVGSHGRSGVGRVVVGSVAETVMRHATCPVLVVRSPS